MYANNEEFLKELEQDYPSMDWDNIPSEDTHPDVYTVECYFHRRLHFFACPPGEGNNWKATEARDIKSEMMMGFGETTFEKAQKIKAMLLDPNGDWQKEMIYEDNSDHPLPSIEYHGPIINDTIVIRKHKPWAAVNLGIMKSLRQEVLENPEKQIFPMYLP